MEKLDLATALMRFFAATLNLIVAALHFLNKP